MADDPFQDLLELEDEFYKEGYEAGVADSSYAGMIEGKVFGIEKGYEKALELAKMRGRAVVWNARAVQTQNDKAETSGIASRAKTSTETFELQPLDVMQRQLDGLPSNSRLQKHIDNLLSLTNSTNVKSDNSDESVADFDDRLAKARTKAKVIASIVGEPLNPAVMVNSGIEDAVGLNARH